MSRPTAFAFLLAAALGLWMAATTPVFAQEAYYWSYAERPALGYFDHPPMVAWLIALGTAAFGDNTLGLRAGTLLSALGLTWIGWRWLRDLGGDAWTEVAWIVLSFAVPMLAVGHVLANPDAPLSFFWTVSAWSLWRARARGELRWWLLAGLAAGAALLSKYSAVFLAGGSVLLLAFDPRLRAQLRRPGPYLGVGLAILAFAPVLIWNAQHDFASFRFQTENRYGHSHFGLHWATQLLLGQLAVLSPLILCLTPFALVWCWRRWRGGDPRGLWLLAFAVPLPLFFGVNSLWLQVKINWLMPAFTPLLLAGLLWWRETRFDLRHPRVARVTQRLALVFAAACPLAPLLDLVPNRGSSWSGWDRIAEAAERWETEIDLADGIEGNVFFFALNYRDAAQLRRSLTRLLATAEPEEVLEPTLAQNVIGYSALQSDYWQPPAERIGQDAVLVLREGVNHAREFALASAHFDSVELVEHVRIRRLWYAVNEADIYLCHRYRGPRS